MTPLRWIDVQIEKCRIKLIARQLVVAYCLPVLAPVGWKRDLVKTFFCGARNNWSRDQMQKKNELATETVWTNGYSDTFIDIYKEERPYATSIDLVKKVCAMITLLLKVIIELTELVKNLRCSLKHICLSTETNILRTSKSQQIID